jgi:hypothetical protein
MQLVDSNPAMYQYVHIRIAAFTTVYVVDHVAGRVGKASRAEHLSNNFTKSLQIAMQLKNDSGVSWIKVSRYSNHVASIEDDYDALDALFKSLAW